MVEASGPWVLEDNRGWGGPVTAKVTETASPDQVA